RRRALRGPAGQVRGRGHLADGDARGGEGHRAAHRGHRALGPPVRSGGGAGADGARRRGGRSDPHQTGGGAPGGRGCVPPGRAGQARWRGGAARADRVGRGAPGGERSASPGPGRARGGAGPAGRLPHGRPGPRRGRGRPGRAIGVLRELVEAPPQLRPAVRAALGPFADAVVYADRAHAVADATASGAGGLVLAVEAVTTGEDGPAPARISGERPLIEAVRPDPRVGGLAATLLGRVYLVNNLAEAAAKHRVHRDAMFVTPEGALVGPLFVRGATGPDERLDHIRRDSAALERELASVRRRL